MTNNWIPMPKYMADVSRRASIYGLLASTERDALTKCRMMQRRQTGNKI